MEPLLLILLAVVMSVVFLLILLLYDWDIMAPAPLITGTMAFSCIIALTQIHNWMLSMSFKGFFGLLVGILSFCIASAWCSRQMQQRIVIEKLPSLNTRKYFFVFSLILMACLAFFSVREIYRLSIMLGNEQGIFYTLKVVRPAIEAQKVQLSRWMSYRMMIAQTITYVYVYIFINQTLSRGFCWKNIFYLLPCVLYIPFMITTTGRMAMITLIIYFIVTAMLLYHKVKGYSGETNRKVILVLLLSGILFFTFFLAMGNFTGKVVSGTRTPMVILAHYAGLSVPAFGTVIEQPVLDSGYIGSNTLLGIYRILSRIGFHLPTVDIFLPFVQFSGIDTNVYTAEWRYIWDYGFTGMVAVMAILGVGYTFSYEYIKNRKVSPLIIMFYGVMAYPLFLSSIDERFMLDLLGTAALYNFCFLYIVYRLAIKK